MIFAIKVDPQSDDHCFVGIHMSWRSFEIFTGRHLDTKGFENGRSEACGIRQSYDHSSFDACFSNIVLDRTCFKSHFLAKLTKPLKIPFN